MKYLVVTTHPLSNSLCKLLTKHVVTTLTAIKHEVVIEDLYAEKFDPVLTAAERECYYSDAYDSSNISEQVERLQEVEALVLLFPTW